MIKPTFASLSPASTVLLSSLFAIASCVSRAPISQSPCPCPEGMGYICCDGRCALPTDTTCGSSSGTSGAAGKETHDAGGAAGNPLVGADARQVDSPVVGYPPVDARKVGSQVGSVAIGTAHACIVRQDGSIECRGNNDYGQATPPAVTFHQVVAGAWHTCGQVQNLADRTKDGGWVCWGDNRYGQATVPPDIKGSYLGAGERHTCGVTSTTQIVCWGDNSLGQLMAPKATGQFPSTIAAGRNHTCAITYPQGGGSPTVACWGDNSRGQSTPPAEVAGALIAFLASGGDHTCASNMAQFAACWGANDAGQSTVPVGWLRGLSLASGHSCSTPFDGLPGDRIQCWGSDWGNSISTPPTGKFNNVFAGDYINCGLPIDATQPLLCWGQTYEPWY